MTDATRIFYAIENGDNRAIDHYFFLYQELRYFTAKKREGIIGLKSETAEILYRNMKIKESVKPVQLGTFIAILPTAQKG